MRFLSTPSARRATFPGGNYTRKNTISIHALREEGDGVSRDMECWISISIHALREEGDHPNKSSGFVSEPISIHALREEGDQGTV